MDLPQQYRYVPEQEEYGPIYQKWAPTPRHKYIPEVDLRTVRSIPILALMSGSAIEHRPILLKSCKTFYENYYGAGIGMDAFINFCIDLIC